MSIRKNGKYEIFCPFCFNKCLTKTQKEAITIAETIAKNQKSDTKIHGKDGKIRGGNSYGNDPNPPKDKK
jgi:hypothetical protein